MIEVITKFTSAICAIKMGKSSLNKTFCVVVIIVSYTCFHQFFEAFQQISNLIHLENDSSFSSDDPTQKVDPSSTLRSTKNALHESDTTLLDDWRAVTDCNIYDLSCPFHKKFAPHPFRRLFKHKKDHEIKFEKLKTESFFPVNTTNTYKGFDGYLYPTIVSKEAKDECMKLAQGSLDEQVKQMIHTRLKQVSIKSSKDPNEVTNFVAFTITDKNYAKFMLHETYQMTRDIIKFNNAHFFVGMDLYTVDMACSYGYPIVYYKHDDDNQSQTEDKDENENDAKTRKKGMVQNSKLMVSQMLLNMDQAFMFYEMDVWFVKSPIEILEDMTKDMVVSTHENHPFQMNIGFYAMKANDASREYMDKCVQMQTDIPNAHDQEIMSRLAEVFEDRKMKTFKPGEEAKFRDQITYIVPKVEHPFTAEKLGPMIMVAHDHPSPTDETVSFHVLADRPLTAPFGKMILAKEIGAWYGFSNCAINNNKISSGQGRESSCAGYYDRNGKYRRYLLLDSDGALGGHPMTRVQGYHSQHHLQWKIAILVTLARHTNRILILPKTLSDKEKKFLWTGLDMKSVEDLGVQWRETNFFTNKKAWYTETLPFSSVARVMLRSSGKLLLHTQNEKDLTSHSKGRMTGWDIESDRKLYFDALFSMSMKEPEVREVEALMVDPHDLLPTFFDLSKDADNSTTLHEIRKVFDLLRWCRKDGDRGFHFVEHPLAPTSVRSTDNCYSRGVEWDKV